MSIGSHTWSHRNLAQLPVAAVEADLRRSRAVLERRLGEPVRTIAYPWGKLGRHVNGETFAAARRAGFELGLISLPRAVSEHDDPLRVARLGVGDDPVDRLAAKVTGAIDWHAYVHERLPAPVARLIFAEEARA
jgi:peptidoglycan/xylan/chitin deacetylase (PgdA/CDA1 family)